MVPVPYDENKCPDKFWPMREPWNDLVKSLRPGWITDFVFATRGIHSPTPFAVWTAIMMVSAVARRYAWLNWYPDKFYLNLYTILVAMPSLCGKSTIIDSFGGSILSKYAEYIENDTLRKMRTLPIFRDKITPEGLFLILENTLLDIPQSGISTKFKTLGADALILASDLPTLLGKQTYNEGLLGLLTRAYDCPDVLEYTSLGRGTIRRERPYLTMLGGATRDSLAASVPQETFGEGFMSRLIPVYVGRPTRGYDRNIQPKGAPSIADLSERLAWIALNASGEFVNTPAADELWTEWHKSFFDQVMKSPESFADMRSRVRVTVKKLSVLIRLSQYEPASNRKMIERTDLAEAIEIVERTYRSADTAIERVGESEYHKKMRKVEIAIHKRQRCVLRDITQATHLTKGAGELIMILKQLQQEGRIEMFIDGAPRNNIQGDKKEEYRWVEGLHPRG